MKKKHKVNNLVYDSHAQLAKDFDFVVGHVNVGSYFNELGIPKLEEHLFLADYFHTNQIGHLAQSYLLLKLLSGKGRWAKTKNNKIITEQPSKIGVENYSWFCGNNTKDKRFIQNRIVQNGSLPGWQSPLGSMTLETPRNDIRISGSKQLIVQHKSPNEIKVHGEQDPSSLDQQDSISLECCTGNSINKFTTVIVAENTDPMQNAQAIFFGFGQGLSNFTNLRVYIDSENNSANGRLIKVPNDWPCYWTWRDMYDTWWFAFDDKQPKISSMQLCVEHERCETSGISNNMLISMAVYA